MGIVVGVAEEEGVQAGKGDAVLRYPVFFCEAGGGAGGVHKWKVTD